MDKKTECEITQDLLLGYVDDVLNAESKKIVEKHLLECEKCQAKVNEIKNDIEKIAKQKFEIKKLDNSFLHPNYNAGLFLGQIMVG